MIKLSTSILSSSNRLDSINKLNNTTTDYVHIDVMDNRFVPNYQLPLDEVEELKKITKKQFDIHLMMEDPEPFIRNITSNKVESISIHVEIDRDINKLITLIKSYGYNVGLAINPTTEPERLIPYLDEVDKILVMSVEPGYGKQKFIDSTIDKIIKIRNMKADILIEVDGGINDEVIKDINLISDIAVVGSFITNNDNYQEAINKLKI